MSDVQLKENGDLPLQTELTDGVNEIIQKILIRLQTFEGEWMLDQTAGLPWLRWLETKSPPTVEIENAVLEEIQAVEGVEAVELNTVTFDRDDAELALEATVETDQGAYAIDETITPGD
jgi:hypothetical protein